ncbi:MAG: hypothetical protein H7X79_10490 [Sporomusaceae bacterium]|nr:hypothetical protein [Sporomusaceae bacterium]
MIELLVVMSLFLVILGVLVMCVAKSSANDLQQKYIIRGLGLAFILVSVFIIGSWLIGVLFAGMLDAGYVTLGKWTIVVLIISLFFEQSQRRKPMQELPPHINRRVISQLPTLKIHGMDKVVISGFRKRH